MGTVSDIIGKMRDVAPPGQSHLDDATLELLRDLTQSLISAKEGFAEEHARFLAIGERGLCLPEAALAERLRDATVLVTGGTGCIGSTLIGQLAARGAGRLVSVSRGISNSMAQACRRGVPVCRHQGPRRDGQAAAGSPARHRVSRGRAA